MIVIPARLASTRFPNKILADIAGLPMVVRTAKRVASVDRVVVACDDEGVMMICAEHGIEAVLTSKNHQSGTDRINEAAKLLGAKSDEIIVNVQADEPFIEPQIVAKLFEAVRSTNNGFAMASAYKKISVEAAKDPNLVKVITDGNGDAIYFSRSVVPHDRDGGFDGYKGHLGLYAFDAKSLDEFCALPHSLLEHTEKLEQLRVIEAGKKIRMIEVSTKSFGIDTIEDLQKALEANLG
jgi:3-deoxy-manno-octulosonate cytidylyltransferase (CMP-KDO synthetase)